MNGFISRYRWIIILVALGLAAVLIITNQQAVEPVEIVAEENDTSDAVVEQVVEPEIVTEPEVVATEETTIEVAEEAPVEEIVVQEEVDVVEPAVEEVAVVEPEPEIQEPEPEVVEPVSEEVVTEEVVVEEATVEVVDETPVEVTDEPSVEIATEEVPTEVIPEEVVEEEATPAVEPEEIEEPTSDEPVTEEVAEEQIVETSEAEVVVEGLTAEIANTVEEATSEEGIKPSFDVVRVDNSGSAVIAGNAEPYSKVVILSNGEEIGEAIAGGSGEFVAIIQVPENDQGQTLELESEVSGELLFSDETILILPVMRSTAADTVIEETAPPIIRASEDEVVILQGAPKLGIGHVSLDSISYDENDEVVLAGRGNPGRTVIIYVDDTPLMDTVVSDSGSWKQALHGLDAGRYVLRVDEIDEDGNVTSRVESPFQREYPEDVREAKSAMIRHTPFSRAIRFGLSRQVVMETDCGITRYSPRTKTKFVIPI